MYMGHLQATTLLCSVRARASRYSILPRQRTDQSLSYRLLVRDSAPLRGTIPEKEVGTFWAGSTDCLEQRRACPLVVHAHLRGLADGAAPGVLAPLHMGEKRP